MVPAPGIVGGMQEEPYPVEVHAGRSDRTPAILWAGMHVVVGAFVAVLVAICLILYFVLK